MVQQKITVWVIVGAIVIIIAYDVTAFVIAGNNATISHVILVASKNRPIIAFAAGVLCGHLFASQRNA
jgi:hypothetical protein